MLTPAQLQAAVGCTQERALQFARPLAEACERFDITTPARLAAFLAQIGHESGSLRYVRELASGEAYEGRKDLGNVYQGDGVLFKGHGLIQITGRANHRELRPQLLLAGYDDVPDFEGHPEALCEPRWAAASAAAYWHKRDLNALADTGREVDFERITKRVNGGLNGQADRLARWERAKAALAQGTAPAPAPAPLPPTLSKEAPMAPLLQVLLPSLVSAVPKLASLFGSGSEVSNRNIKAAEIAFSVAKDALGAANEQEVIERVQADPQAATAVTQAIESNWYVLTEAGSGGIDGARRFAREAGADSPQVWRILAIVTYCAIAFLLLANLIAAAAWGVAMVRSAGIESATQILVQVIAADILSATSAISFWLGSSFGSRRKDAANPA